VKPVNIAKLKAHLASYLRAVRAGEEVVVLDRKIPVARIVPYREASREPLETRKPVEDPASLARLAPKPAGRRKTDSVRVLLEDRARR